MKRKFYLIFLTVFFLEGCSTERIALRMALPLVEGQYTSIQEEKDPELAEKAIPASLKMMEGFLKRDPGNAKLLQRLAEGFCGYAFSFLEDTDPLRASDLYLRGRQYASRALKADSDLTGLETQGLENLKTELGRATEDSVASLFWMGQCWGGWLRLNLDRPEAFADISKVEQVMQRVVALDETYNYAGPHLFLGVFYGGRSKLLGGNPEKAQFHFERNLALTGNKYLLTHYLYARTYAVQVQNVKLFERLLAQVKDAPADGLPEQRLANEVAKMKAERLSQQAEELF